MTNSKTTFNAEYLHNIERDLEQVVAQVRRDSIGNTRAIAHCCLALTLMASAVLSTGHLPWEGSPTFLGLLTTALITWLAYVELMFLPSARLNDEHLALLAAIGFNQRHAGKWLQVRLKEDGFITYKQLQEAQQTYRAERTRVSGCMGEGAKKYLASAD